MVSPTPPSTHVGTPWTRTVVSPLATQSGGGSPHIQGSKRIDLFSSLRPWASRRCFALPISDSITSLDPNRGLALDATIGTYCCKEWLISLRRGDLAGKSPSVC